MTRICTWPNRIIIGIVGTIEEAQSAEYLLNKIESYKQFSQGIPQAPKFDIWVQHQNGSHRFDIMDHSKFFPLIMRQFLFLITSILTAYTSGVEDVYKCHQYHCTPLLSWVSWSSITRMRKQCSSSQCSLWYYPWITRSIRWWIRYCNNARNYSHHESRVMGWLPKFSGVL